MEPQFLSILLHLPREARALRRGSPAGSRDRQFPRAGALPPAPSPAPAAFSFSLSLFRRLSKETGGGRLFGWLRPLPTRGSSCSRLYLRARCDRSSRDRLARVQPLSQKATGARAPSPGSLTQRQQLIADTGGFKLE